MTFAEEKIAAARAHYGADVFDRWSPDLQEMQAEKLHGGHIPTYTTAPSEKGRLEAEAAKLRAWSLPLTSIELSLLGDSRDEDYVSEVKQSCRGISNPADAKLRPSMHGRVWA